MRWFDDYISFRSKDHPDTELSERNLSFIVKILIGRHKVAKTLIDNGASLNLMMRKIFIEMRLNLSNLTPVHDTFHVIILVQSSTPIGCIDLEVSCGTVENMHTEILTFEVVSFDIKYNCILGMPFLLKLMTVIHTTYATIKMSGPRGVITLKSYQCYVLAYENAALTHAGKFSKKEAQNLAAKVAKTHGEGTPTITVTPRSLAGNTPKTPVVKKSTMVTPTSTLHTTDQLVYDEIKGAANKEIQVDPSDAVKKLHVSTELEAK
jgi:hypothetical protein